MARYEHLPIYKTSMEYAVKMEKHVRNMSRYNKYTLGTELRNRAIKGLSHVVRANSVKLKKPVLEELRVILEESKQLLFLSKETGALASFGVYRDLMESLDSLIRQNEGWLKCQN